MSETQVKNFSFGAVGLQDRYTLMSDVIDVVTKTWTPFLFGIPAPFSNVRNVVDDGQGLSSLYCQIPKSWLQSGWSEDGSKTINIDLQLTDEEIAQYVSIKYIKGLYIKSASSNVPLDFFTTAEFSISGSILTIKINKVREMNTTYSDFFLDSSYTIFEFSLVTTIENFSVSYIRIQAPSIVLGNGVEGIKIMPFELVGLLASPVIDLSKYLVQSGSYRVKSDYKIYLLEKIGG